jgi:hypothetical protein
MTPLLNGYAPTRVFQFRNKVMKVFLAWRGAFKIRSRIIPVRQKATQVTSTPSEWRPGKAV